MELLYLGPCFISNYVRLQLRSRSIRVQSSKFSRVVRLCTQHCVDVLQQSRFLQNGMHTTSCVVLACGHDCGGRGVPTSNDLSANGCNVHCTHCRGAFSFSSDSIFILRFWLGYAISIVLTYYCNRDFYKMGCTFCVDIASSPRMSPCVLCP